MRSSRRAPPPTLTERIISGTPWPAVSLRMFFKYTTESAAPTAGRSTTQYSPAKRVTWLIAACALMESATADTPLASPTMIAIPIIRRASRAEIRCNQRSPVRA